MEYCVRFKYYIICDVIHSPDANIQSDPPVLSSSHGNMATAKRHGLSCFVHSLTDARKARSCAGVLVDGRVRDVADLRITQFAIMVR